MLHAPHSLKNTLLSSALWDPDKPGAFNLVNMAVAAINPGSFSRANRINKSETCELKGQVLVDCLKVSKPLLDGVDIGLNFYVHEAKACLVADWPATAASKPEYIIEIEDAKLEVGRIHAKQSAVQQCIYPYVHRDLLHMLHEKTLSYFGPVTVASGILPKRIIVGLITETAYNGNYKENRLNFIPHNVDNVVVRVNSVDKPCRGGYVMNYKENMYMDAYYGLYKELGQTSGECQCGPVTFEEFDAGYTIYAFDTSPDRTASSIEYGRAGSGTCELMIHFKETPLSSNIVILVMMEFERKFTLRRLEQGNLRQYQFESRS